MEKKIFSCIESRIKNKNSYYSRFYLGPFPHNKVLTYSNTLRRTLLSDNTSINVIALNIFGVKHEYSSLQGIKESVLDILLNFKQLTFISNEYLIRTIPYVAYLRKRGNAIIRAKDIILPSVLKCVDENQYLATILNDGELIVKMLLSSPSPNLSSLSFNDQFHSLLTDQTTYLSKSTNFLIPIDSNFSSVNKVNYLINRLDELETFSDYLLLEIWTNGSISPCFALQNSIKLLIELFLSFYDFSFSFSILNSPNYLLKNFVVSTLKKTSFVKKNFFNQNVVLDQNNENSTFLLDNLAVSLHIKFLLKRANIFTIRDLLKMKKNWLIKYCNISKKSLHELQDSLLVYNIYLKD
uniref:DNA-directed RNA polymerase n=1 Tax=Lotharella vacuolata TaxID=74820 RepID=A0A140JZU5_9EUKA|nr:RNA polymerase alpha subunit [Lotharella vacuolata]BAU62622.1 RNA polymerase alpha subunit [Lotharella vacuolata]